MWIFVAEVKTFNELCAELRITDSEQGDSDE